MLPADGQRVDVGASVVGSDPEPEVPPSAAPFMPDPSPESPLPPGAILLHEETQTPCGAASPLADAIPQRTGSPRHSEEEPSTEELGTDTVQVVDDAGDYLAGYDDEFKAAAAMLAKMGTADIEPGTVKVKRRPFGKHLDPEAKPLRHAHFAEATKRAARRQCPSPSKRSRTKPPHHPRPRPPRRKEWG